MLTRERATTHAGQTNKTGACPIARHVKIADLKDNMDVTRLDAVGDADAERLAKYLWAWTALMS